MKILVSLVVATVVALALSLMIYLGTFKPVTVAVEEAGPFRVVFKQHVGAYHKIVPVIEEVEGWAKKNGETCRISFGEYSDDPTVVDEDRLRSNGGCVVEGDWTGPLPQGLEYKEIPRREYVTAIFDGAPSISPYKVYPKAQEYMESMNLKAQPPVLEMYERLPDQKLSTRYLFSFTRGSSAP